MRFDFSGLNEDIITLECEDTDIYMGTPVKMVKPGKVAACVDGDNMIGVAVNVRNGYAAVQLSGYIEMPTDENFAVGYQNISVGVDNKVKAAKSGREYLVIYTDIGVVGFILR